MRAIFLLLLFLSWGTSLARAAECPMGGPPEAAHVEEGHGAGPHGHHRAPREDGHPPAECGVGMPCGVPALAAAESSLPRVSVAAAPSTVRAVRAYASPDLAAEPPPPRTEPRS